MNWIREVEIVLLVAATVAVIGVRFGIVVLAPRIGRMLDRGPRGGRGAR